MSTQKIGLWRTFFQSIIKTAAGVMGIGIGLALTFIVIGLPFSLSTGRVIAPISKSFNTVVVPDHRGIISPAAAHNPLILQLPIKGTIGGRTGVSASNIQQILYHVENEPLKRFEIAAVLLHIDSPGGGVQETAQIYEALLEFKKKHKIPVYAYVEGICASGGMMIACCADKIFSSTDSLIGSIGVIMGPMFNLTGGMQMININAATLTEGTDKDMGNPFRSWTAEEFAPIEPILEAFYTRFINIVAQARPQLTPEQIRDQLGARIFIGSEAAKLGLIDGSGASRSHVLKELTMQAGCEDDYRVIEVQPPTQFLRDLLEAGVEGVAPTPKLQLPSAESWLELVRSIH